MQKILIVEDDYDIQDILKNHLIDVGYEVVVVSDGVVWIAMFDDTMDLILLDIMLPKIDGYGVCEVIRKKSQVPIFIEVRMRSLRSKIQIMTSMTPIKPIMTSKMILKQLIRKNPELTHKALGEALAVSAATIKRTLTKMQHEGKVIREGSNRKGKWILTDKMK